MKHTPWGKPQTVTEISPGILSVSTAGHGGLKLDRKLNAQMPEGARRKGGWYEEDCEWSLVALRFPRCFDVKEVDAARVTAKNWYPEEYTAITGEEVAEAESLALKRRAFTAATRDRFVVYSALGKGNVVVAHAKKASTGELAVFHVPGPEYTVPFVIDESRHQRVT